MDQAAVIDYFHRIAKGGSLWLKIGTIRHRTSWYIHGDPPIGLKLGDDADEINLDLTLEKYSLAKEFLFKILQGLSSEVELSTSDIIADGARDRLVLASGGVARDFLNIFRKSIDIGRERGGGGKGERINGEDVNNAAGEYDATKQEEFKLDTLDDSQPLDKEFTKIKRFCLESSNHNCFLVHTDSKSNEISSYRNWSI